VFGKKIYGSTTEADHAIVDKVAEVAKRRGVPMAQVALAWVLQKGGVTSPIVGATKPEHLRDAVASLELKLTAEEVAELEAPYVPHAVAGFN
jgi:aryl-alcohol dehydrogenase-like predicted oxidoreductase